MCYNLLTLRITPSPGMTFTPYLWHLRVGACDVPMTNVTIGDVLKRANLPKVRVGVVLNLTKPPIWG